MMENACLSLAPLSLKAERAQWRAADVADWPEKKALPRWLGRKFQVQVLSQLYHGERATLAMCRQLKAKIDDPWAQRCLDFQIMDEERHARVYLDYLAGIGELQPLDPVLAAAYERALGWSGRPEGMIAAFNVILEGEALFALDYLGGWFRCPLFARINARIRRDEARHLAFGRAYLAETLPQLPLDERLEIHRWLKALWQDTAEGVFRRFPVTNLFLRRRCRTWVETGWQDHLKILKDVGLLKDGEIHVGERT
ncbi:MAG: ferritin-like domain-containing protein [Proteobacteria bacterium]|nr:ferritin-like domain-containing protein [Pseudomonadota bacterium]MDA1022466.1 ferritin-like domain-containing protein [Pseudomonadota bacterium]